MRRAEPAARGLVAPPPGRPTAPPRASGPHPSTSRAPRRAVGAGTLAQPRWRARWGARAVRPRRTAVMERRRHTTPRPRAPAAPARPHPTPLQVAHLIYLRFKGLQRVQNCKNNGPSLYQWTGQDLPDLADTHQPVILWMGHA